MKIEIAGDCAVIAYFAQAPSAEVSSIIQQTEQGLRQLLGDGLVDTVISYASLLVIFDPLKTDAWAVEYALGQSFQLSVADNANDGRLVTLPVYYGVDAGPDLADLAQRANLSIEQVIDIHQGQEYRVYAIGFAPGFAYLGQVDERISAPRLATPRTRVPRGAVAIADRQTAVYPASSPGGWNLIGLCPQPMFDPVAEPTMPVAAGDRVRFEAISREQFLARGGCL